MSDRRLRSQSKAASAPPTQAPTAAPAQAQAPAPIPAAISYSTTTTAVTLSGALFIPSTLPAPITTLPSFANTSAAHNQAATAKHRYGRREMTYPLPARPSNPSRKQFISVPTSASVPLQSVAAAALAAADSLIAVDTSLAPDTSNATSNTNANTNSANKGNDNDNGSGNDTVYAMAKAANVKGNPEAEQLCKPLRRGEVGVQEAKPRAACAEEKFQGAVQ